MNPSLSTMSLRNKLSQVKSRDLYGREFISRSALRQLITVAATKWHLVWSCKVDPEPTIVESIVQNASQLFAILIMISEERFVSEAIKQGWCDDKLPLSEADAQYFRDLRISRCFMETQWLFPPVFRSKSHLELPGNAALPFTDREFLGDGAFGVVVSIKVAEGHLPEHNTVSLTISAS